MSTRCTSMFAVAVALAAGSACDTLESPAPVVAAAAPAAAAAEYQPSYVDSIFPMEEEIDRFRRQAGPPVTALTGGASSREDLVRAWIAALEERDPSGLPGLVLTPGEFIYLYYPHTRFVSPPYELAPRHVWFQLENSGSKGLSRAMERFGGRALDYRGHRCEDIQLEGPNRIAGDCVARVTDAAGNHQWVPLLGRILERDGRFRFISLANGL